MFSSYRTMCRDNWLLFLCLTRAYVQVCHGNTIALSSQSLDQWENTDVTLTCSYNGSYPEAGFFYWILNNPLHGERSCYVDNRNKVCKLLNPWLANSTLFSYNCTNETEHSVTIKSITQQRHGETWTCQFDLPQSSITSTGLQILVKVPVKSSTITPKMDTFTKAENTTFSWHCLTSECRPEPRFVWYKQLDEHEVIISEIEPTNTTGVAFLSYTNTYNVHLNRTWNGWYLLCGAQNLEGSIILSRKILLNVTYPPRVNPLKEKIILEGKDLLYSCDITDGNPKTAEFKWMRENNTWIGQLLSLHNISRKQSGMYTCIVQNYLIGSDTDGAQGTDSGQFNLIVQYTANVRTFVVEGFGSDENITANEGVTVKLVCEIEGNPLATGEIFKEDDYIRKKFKLPVLTYNASDFLRIQAMFTAKCTDTGILTCTGRNTLYTQFVSQTNKSFWLHVNCSPRKSPFHQFPPGDIVVSALSVPVTMNFTILAFPIPLASGYVWSRKTEGTMQIWTTFNSSDNSVLITTLGLQSNLTITKVSSSDNGIYRAMVENSIGWFAYTFTLQIEDGMTDSLSKCLIGEVAGGTSASVAVLVFVIVCVIIHRKRRAARGKTTSIPSTSNVLSDRHEYQNSSDDDVHKYSTDGGSSSVYEGLQIRGFDLQYDELALMALHFEKGQQKTYENLQLTSASNSHVGV